MNYWSLPIVAVLMAIIVSFGLLEADRAGLTAWMLANDLSPVATADTARDFAGIASGVDAAFVSLYFSITLIVLSLAAGNLGVRLIDRWLTKRLVRVSISGLSFSLIVSLMAMLSVDPDAELADTPLGLIAVVMALQAVNIAMLAVSLHDLGRTMFIDTSIDRLAKDARTTPVQVIGRPAAEIEFRQTLRASRAGYVEGNDLSDARKRLRDHPGVVRFCAAPGQHVLEGQPLVVLENAFDEPDAILRCVPIGPYRSDSQGTVFQVRLLVEIAARALSPAVNDFYTAIAAADNLAVAMADHASIWVSADRVTVLNEEPRFELPGQDFRGLFQDPMNAFRQAACDYPSVTIRMINNYKRLIVSLHEGGDFDPDHARFLGRLARELRDHAAEVTEYDGDRREIGKSYQELEAVLDSLTGSAADRVAAD